ncbi:hypothetical protein UlMin_040926 [Ulmus minor]
MHKVLGQELSNDTTLKRFMESCFGHFIKMSHHWQLSAQLIHYLLLRRIKCEKKQELWFLIDGNPMRFGLQEFVLVTKLNSFAKRIIGEKRLKTIDLEYLIQSDNTTEDDRLKISLVYVLCQVLFPTDEKRNVPREWLAHANDLSFFNSYPWGRECYEVTIKGLQIDLRPKLEMYLALEGKEVKISYTIFGFLWALPLGSEFGHCNILDKQLPRMVRMYYLIQLYEAQKPKVGSDNLDSNFGFHQEHSRRDENGEEKQSEAGSMVASEHCKSKNTQDSEDTCKAREN